MGGRGAPLGGGGDALGALARALGGGGALGATLGALTLAGVLAFAAAAHAAQPAGLSEGWGMKLFVAVLLALVAAVSGFGSPPKDREAETPMREARISYAAQLGGAPSMPRTGWQPTSEGGTDPSDCVRCGPPQPDRQCPARPRLSAACQRR